MRICEVKICAFAELPRSDLTGNKMKQKSKTQYHTDENKFFVLLF